MFEEIIKQLHVHIGNIPSLSFGGYPYHLFAAPLSSTPYFPSPVSPACVDILAMR